MKKIILVMAFLLFYSTSHSTWREGGGGDADASEALSLMKNELVDTLKWSKSEELNSFLSLSDVQEVIAEIDYSLNKTETSFDDLLVFDEDIKSSGTSKGCKYQRNNQGQSRIFCDRETWAVWSSIVDKYVGQSKKVGTLYKEIAGVKGLGSKDRYAMGSIVEATFLEMKRAQKRKKRRRKGLEALKRLQKESKDYIRELERESRNNPLKEIPKSRRHVDIGKPDPDVLADYSRRMSCELARRACSKGNSKKCFSLRRSCGGF